MLNFCRTPWRPAIAVLLGISLVLTLLARAEPVTADPTSDLAPKTYLKYYGLGNYAEVANSPAFSLSNEGLTVAVWMRPDALVFPKREGRQANEQYVHWLGKGQAENQEWAFRMYSLKPPGPRKNRISFYVFSPAGNRGCGSYFQDPVAIGQWIQVVGVADAANKTTSIYKKRGVPASRLLQLRNARTRSGAATLRDQGFCQLLQGRDRTSSHLESAACSK